jgi:hypothetical protein
MEKITLPEIKKLLEEEGISPDEVFGIAQLKESPSMQGYIEERERKAAGGEFSHRERTDKKFVEESEKWEKEKKEKDEEIKKLKIDGAKRDATELFSSKMKERKVDKQQEAFLKSKQSDFTPEDPEKLDKEVDTFLDVKVEEYNKTAKIFGRKTGEPKGGEPKGGGEPGEGGSSEEDEFIAD